MFLKKIVLRTFITSLMTFTILATNSVFAERVIAPGYVTDSDGKIARDSSGKCMHTSSWTPEMAVVVGCDGVVLNTPAKIMVGGSTGDPTAFVLPAASLFGFDDAELTAQGKKELLVYRAKIQPELAQAFAVVIVGHTDSKGDPKYNIDLSKRRAESVRNFLVAGGIPGNKLRVVGMGAKEPIASNSTDKGRALNRRVEIVIFGEQRGLDVLHFPSVGLFPRKSDELSKDGKLRLEKKVVASKMILSRAVYIEVIGHTDDVGDKKENQKLSEMRAWSVSHSLVKAGVDPNLIMAVGAGSTQPIASNQTDEGRAQNRRVEVIVLGRLR